MSESRTKITIPAPRFDHKGPALSDAYYARTTAEHIERNALPGSNCRAATARLLRDAAEAMDGERSEPGDSGLPDLCAMTYEQRKALPPEFHQPEWSGMSQPAYWCCAVCWDEGLTQGWPCEVANEHGAQVAQEGGMRWSD